MPAADSGNPTTKALAGSSTDNVHGIPQHAHVNTVERRGDYIDDEDKDPGWYRDRDNNDDDDERGSRRGKNRGRPPIHTKSRHVRRSGYDSDDDRPGCDDDWDTGYPRTKGGSRRGPASAAGRHVRRSDYDSDTDRPDWWNDWDTKYKRTKGGSSRSAATSNGKAAARP
ncbi:hypothetical protein MCOR07_000749 [Pyricularia oryzae]|nr:hypothetical protein MCOR07_000749 [Pyricularia oryzae]